MSPLAQELVVATVKCVVIFGLLLNLFSVMTYIERRVLAFMQFRVGPNRTGWFGILQPAADGIKLFFKEELMPTDADKWLFFGAPVVAIAAAFLSVAVVPYGPPFTLFGRVWQLQVADLNVGILYIFAITSLGVYGLVLAGWAANSKFAMLGGLRSSAQMFSYELSLGLSWVGLIMATGSFRINDLVAHQAGWFHHWNLIRHPVAFLVYFVAATAEVSRIPFDLPEGESELVAGFHTEYSSMKFALIQMAEYVNLISVAVLATHLFLGGWNSGIMAVPSLGIPAVPSLGIFGFVWFSLKVAVLLFVFIWLRGTLPRFRYDQLMDFGWKVLIPVVTLNVLVTGGLILAGVHL